MLTATRQALGRRLRGRDLIFGAWIPVTGRATTACLRQLHFNGAAKSPGTSSSTSTPLPSDETAAPGGRPADAVEKGPPPPIPNTAVEKEEGLDSKPPSEGKNEPSASAETAPAAHFSGPASSPASPTPDSAAETPVDSAVPNTNSEDRHEVWASEPEPVRWIQPAYQDPGSVPLRNEKGEYIVSRVAWPTGEVAYRTPLPTDDKLAPRFGYNVVQVRKHVSWWKYNQKYPRLSLAYINIQVVFLLGLAWLVAFLTTEYRQTTDAMRTPGAMVGEHRGKGPATNRTQKVTFEKEEMGALMEKAQSNWYDGAAEASYVGSKEYKMKAIPRPKEFSVDDFRKR